MFLKNYQLKVVKAISAFLKSADKKREEFRPILKQFPQMKSELDYAKTTFEEFGLHYNDTAAKTGLGDAYPRIVVKVPTGGGKTLLAVETIREYQNKFAKSKQGLVVWIVPSETIYAQTIKKLKDKGNPLRQLLDQCSGGSTLILEKGQRLIAKDIEENLVVLFIMIQSVARLNGKESLKVFQDSGGFEGFFPPDYRYDLHREIIKEVPNLDYFSDVNSAMPQIKTSLGNAIRVSNPLILIDEIHKVFSDNAKHTINNLNPSMVFGFSATPKPEMNIVVSVSGTELKDEDMVKLDLHINPPISKLTNDWKLMLKEIKQHRDKLEKAAAELQENEGTYIRPIALIQVERTGKEQRTGEWVHSLDVKEALIELGINIDEIAIKTSSQNDIEDIDLLSRNIGIRYIITKDALREGWDCSFAYILGIVPNVNSNTGLTQLVGRILRQPYAKKTNIKVLDESYVYFVKGATQNILEQVLTGFKNEGLEDLIVKVKFEDNKNVNESKKVKIKNSYREKFNYAFYIPIWLIVDGNKRRKFSYDLDIKPFLDFEDFALDETFLSNLKSSLSEAQIERKVFLVTLDQESKTRILDGIENVSISTSESLGYATRRFTEIIDNPFLARKISKKLLKDVKKIIGEIILGKHFGYIVSEIVSSINQERIRQEEEIFISHLNNNKLILSVSDNEKYGFVVPESDLINVNSVPHLFKNCLYEDVDLSSMNTLEKNVAEILDQQDKILWWFRNKVSKGWYSIQGWQKNKIRPDFIVAKKSEEGSLELIFVLESKGKMLIGNDDTIYKQKVMAIMNKQKVKPYQTELKYGVLNEKVEYYMIKESREEAEIRSLMS